jgi:hypothetical protein
LPHYSPSIKSLPKLFFWLSAACILLLFWIVTASVLASPQSQEQEVPTNTPVGFTPTPFPTSTTPANITIIGNARVEAGTSLAIDNDGLPIIAYSKRLTSGLAVARCNDATSCDSPTIMTLDSADIRLPSLLLDGNLPVVSYQDTNNDLKLARCQDVACTSVNVITVDTGDAGPFHNALALDSNGIAVIAYIHTVQHPGTYDRTLKLAHCNNLICDNPTITTIDNYNLLEDISFVLDVNDRPILAYSRNPIKLAICNDMLCTMPFIRTLDSTSNGFYSSMQLGSDGIPVIAYTGNTGLKLARCNNSTICDVPTISTVDNNFNPGYFVSLTLDADNIPVMSHYDNFNHDLRLTRCTNLTCGAPVEHMILDSFGNVGIGTSLVLRNSYPIVSYTNYTTGKLMLYMGDEPPPPPPTNTPITPTSPPNATLGLSFFTSKSLILTWNPVSWAQGYQIQIDDDPNFGSPITVPVEFSTDTLSYTTPELANGTYYWHVRAKRDALNWGNWSATQTFVISSS